MMESINVVIDDEKIVASRKGEEIQPIPENLLTPSADMVKPSFSTQETHVIPSAPDSPPDPLVNETSGNTASASEDEDESTNPPKRSWVKLNHPSQQLIGNLEEGRQLRNIMIQPSTEVANRYHTTSILHRMSQRRLMKPYKMKARSLPCMKNYISLPETMYGLLFQDLLITISLAPSGSSRINQMSMVHSDQKQGSPLDGSRFETLRKAIGVCDMS
jgi:hypothetical protein